MSFQDSLGSSSLISTIWLAANRESPSRGWSWDDGTPFIFANWAKGEFNTGPNQYCAVLSSQLSGQWRTVDCSDSTKFSYICEKDQLGVTKPTMSTAYPLPPSGNFGCKEGWKPFRNNYCYKHFNDKYSYKSFDEAKSTCRSNGAELVEIYNDAENDFVVSLLQMSKIEEEKNVTFKQQTLDCPAQWSKQGDYCYKVMSDTPVTWKKAQDVCAIMGGNLISMKSANDNFYVSALGIKFNYSLRKSLEI